MVHLLSAFILLLSGCDAFRSKKAEPTPMPAAPAPEVKAETPPNTDCEGLEHAKSASLATWTMSNGVQFAVCELGLEAERLSETTFSGWINLARRDEGKLTPLVPEVKSEKPNDVYSFVTQKLSDSEIRISRQIRPLREDIGDGNLAVMERTIVCQKPGACDVGAERCVDFKKDALIDKEAVATVRDVAAGKQKLEELGAYDMIIARLAQAAIAGDPLAKKLMLQTSEKKLKIDGAAAGSFFDGRHLLAAMQKVGCLK